MKKQLTSRLTFIYKFGVPTIWTIVVLGIIGLTFLDSGGQVASFLPLIMLLAIIPFTRLKAITFDERQIYISDGFEVKTFDIDKLKSINAGHLIGFKPFWDIRLVDKKGEIIKVHFMPKLTEQMYYYMTGENKGQMKEIKEIVKRNSKTD